MTAPFNSGFTPPVMPAVPPLRICGPSWKESIYDLAPDLTSLTILGSEDEPSSGFVPLESLLKHSLSAHTLAVHGAAVDGAD